MAKKDGQKGLPLMTIKENCQHGLLEKMPEGIARKDCQKGCQKGVAERIATWDRQKRPLERIARKDS